MNSIISEINYIHAPASFIFLIREGLKHLAANIDAMHDLNKGEDEMIDEWMDGLSKIRELETTLEELETWIKEKR